MIGASESKTAGTTANETVRTHWHALLFNESEKLVGGNLNYGIMTSDQPERQICDSAVLVSTMNLSGLLPSLDYWLSR